MKKTLFILLSVFSLTAYSQNKYDYVHFNKLTEVGGTEYIIASVENRGKTLGADSRYLLFINTLNGEINQVDFPADAIIHKVEQIKIDSLKINLVVVSAKTVDLDGKKGIGWNDPMQIIVLSPDGRTKTQLTDSSLFVREWQVNRTTGTLVVVGHHDSNHNGKYDKTDKNQISIYDLKTLKLIARY